MLRCIICIIWERDKGAARGVFYLCIYTLPQYLILSSSCYELIYFAVKDSRRYSAHVRSSCLGCSCGMDSLNTFVGTLMVGIWMARQETARLIDHPGEYLNLNSSLIIPSRASSIIGAQRSVAHLRKIGIYSFLQRKYLVSHNSVVHLKQQKRKTCAHQDLLLPPPASQNFVSTLSSGAVWP